MALFFDLDQRANRFDDAATEMDSQMSDNGHASSGTTMAVRPAEQLVSFTHLGGAGYFKEGQVTGISSDLATSHGRIADIERRIEALHHRVAQHAPETAEARYAKTALDVLERSLKLMYSQRDRMESELRRKQREARRSSNRWRARVARARGLGPDLVRTVHKLRPTAAREWQKRAGA